MTGCDLPWCERARWRNCSRCGTWPPGDPRNPPTQAELERRAKAEEASNG